ncbi:MotA/TolQ/ExbB proton channel family protein [Ideonella paludis]|uniref:Biopolymer transport protein ExbB n=1 Tax=Ideonella paludis TaxID=1233411 RepID=A0ABS5DS92_9BURK|nr:MotA/TolQ/ExbB proton channel family protein [Ideonella paludis]MBQ0934002.1 MotA/TolQ/ExbB proton channel family protein [Ideonella paludis]
MNGLTAFWGASDAIGRAVAITLLLMSIGAWVVILWKAWGLRRARQDAQRAVAAFWQAPSLAEGQARLAALDREGVLSPLVLAALETPAAGTLQASAKAEAQLTRRLRDALHRSLGHLQLGQVFLASVGATSPFIGLFGTVWGIYHALMGLAEGGGMTMERVSGPVGEALIMTAAGLAVAIPAVLAYNLFGKWINECEAELEGFAHDLRELALDGR